MKLGCYPIHWSRLDAFCNRPLHLTLGYSWQDHMSSQRLHPETGIGPVTCTIQNHQLRIYEYLILCGQACLSSCLFPGIPWVEEGVGRPRKSFLGRLIRHHEELQMRIGPALRHAVGTPCGWRRRLLWLCVLVGVSPTEDDGDDSSSKKRNDNNA